MKKTIVFTMMAVAALVLTSCFGKTATPGQGDPQAEAPNETSGLVEALKAQLTSGNGEGFFALVSNIQEKAVGFIKDNPEKAKEYLGTAQQFLKDNAAKIGELVGTISNSDVAERAKDLIKTVSEQPVDQLLGFVGLVDDKVEGAKDAVEEQVDVVKGAVEGAVDAANDKVEQAKEVVGKKVDEVKDVIDKANDVKNAVGTVLGQ